MVSFRRGSMLRIGDIQSKRPGDGERRIMHFSPQGFFPPGQTLAINLEAHTITLLSDGPTVIVEQKLSVNEMYLFVPILDYFPHYCPYEVLLAYLATKVVTE